MVSRRRKIRNADDALRAIARRRRRHASAAYEEFVHRFQRVTARMAIYDPSAPIKLALIYEPLFNLVLSYPSGFFRRKAIRYMTATASRWVFEKAPHTLEWASLRTFFTPF